MRKKRLDDLLIEQGFFSDADAALRAVIAGEVLVDDVVASSAAAKVALDAVVRVRGKGRYVSRGGEKLKAAIDAFDVDVAGCRCLDIGSSTGGFTDCLLQEGAAHVSCVDVNYGQLDWRMRSDARTQVFERTNIRKADPVALGAPFDVVVIDVSFIGLASLAADIARFCRPGTVLLALVKPQFESRRGEAEGGVVRDEAVRLRTVQEVECSLRENGFTTNGTAQSPLRGPSGNIEYLLEAEYVGD